MLGNAGQAAALSEVMKNLGSAWSTSGEHWSDISRQGFDHDYLQPIIREIELTIRGINEIENILQTMQRECSD